MINKNKFGQAAVEYLVTYGWVLILILLAVGTFTYLGIMDASEQLPTVCEIEQGPFECLSFQIDSSGQVLLNIKNIRGRDYNINAIEFTYPSEEKITSKNFNGLGDFPLVSQNDEIFACKNGPSINPGFRNEKDVVKFKIIYSETDVNALPKSIVGQLTGVVRDDLINFPVDYPGAIVGDDES